METETGRSNEAVPGFQESIQDICRGLDLSEDVVDTAVELLDEYRDDFKANDDYLPPAVVHVASRLEDEPRTQKMIVDYLEQDDHLFSSSDDRLERRLREDVKKLRKMPDIDLPVIRSKDHLDYISSQLHFSLNRRVLEAAEAYCTVVETRPGMSRSKAAVAGACLKAVVEDLGRNHAVTHTRLADITGMNEKTFEKNLSDIRENIIKPVQD